MARLQCARASYEFITIQLLDQCQSNLIFNSLFSWPFLPRRNCLSTYNCLIKPVMMSNWSRTRSGTNRFQKDFLPPNILSNSSLSSLQFPVQRRQRPTVGRFQVREVQPAELRVLGLQWLFRLWKFSRGKLLQYKAPVNISLSL